MNEFIANFVGVAAPGDPQLKFAHIFFWVAEGGDPYNAKK
jgi:hypothetical protein